MVAKPVKNVSAQRWSLNLAKIHMVAKLSETEHRWIMCLNLAKIHMVAKLERVLLYSSLRLNLAKIHMVAKLYKAGK